MAATYSYKFADSIYHFNQPLDYTSIQSYSIEPRVYVFFSTDLSDNIDGKFPIKVVKLITISDKNLVYAFIDNVQVDVYDSKVIYSNFLNTGESVTIYINSRTNTYIVTSIESLDQILNSNTSMTKRQLNIITAIFNDFGTAEINQKLIEAVKNGDYELVQQLIIDGANVNALNGEALEHAARNGRDTIVQLLLENGAKGDVNDYEALRKAMIYNRVNIVKIFIAAGVNVHIKDEMILQFAAQNGHIEFVELLLAAKANVHAQDDGALRLAASDGHANVVKLLLAAKANVHARNDEALRMAAWNGHVNVVKLLLAAGANVHANDDEALRMAAQHDRVEVVKILLAAGANIHAQNDNTLYISVQLGYVKVVELLLTNSNIANSRYTSDVIREALFLVRNDEIEEMLEVYDKPSMTKAART